MAPTRNLPIILEHKGPITLRPSDHIATGGQGSVYRVAGKAVKIYLRPDEARSTGLPDKIHLLSSLKHPYVNAPEGLVLDPYSSLPIGHYLPFIDSGHALSLVFTNDFWKKENFNTSSANILVSRIRETVEFAHAHTPSALLIDANELNWFAILSPTITSTSTPPPTPTSSSHGPSPCVIDVDSWAIDRWKPEVIMPSIRDWHSSTFSQLTDWFSWGIVTFQIYTGIHPYKGTLDGFSRSDMLGRMKANASVFTKGVRLNAAVRDFSTIPSRLHSWYESTFQSTVREKPPSPFDVATSISPATRVLRVATSTIVSTTGSGTGSGSGTNTNSASTTVTPGTLKFEKILSTPSSDPVIRVFHCGVALTSSGKLINLTTSSAICQDRYDLHCEVVEVARVGTAAGAAGGWVVAEPGKQSIGKFTYISKSDFIPRPLSISLASTSILAFGNRLFTVADTGLSEIHIRFFDHPIAAISNTWGIIPNSTRWFEGFGVLDALGSIFLLTPFGLDGLPQTRVPELDGMRVITGKAGERFVSLIAVNRSGDYHKFEFTFDKLYSSYSSWQSSSDSAELNLAILPKGVCATIYKDTELVIFVPSTRTVRHIEDKHVSTAMTLFNWQNTVVSVQNGEVWRVSVTS